MRNKISEEMVTFRAQSGLSQAKCAKGAGITIQTWNQIELGRQSPSRVTETKIRLFMYGKGAEA